jgi:hypothetical protein
MGIPARLGFAAAFLAVSGCVLPNKFIGSEEVAITQPASVVAAWTPKVTFTPDPANGGVPTPGLAGRVYVFGPTPDYPLTSDGVLTVELFDDTVRPGQPAGAQLETWQFDAATMKRLLKKDAIGMGYTVFLPWGTYRPDIKQVHLSLRFDPTGGTPLFAPSGPMTLEHGTPPTGPIASR